MPSFRTYNESSRTASPTTREPLLDLWRGLALIDMAWVHLALYPIGMPALLALWIGEYTRFAAGFFVLLSGSTVALVFGAALAAGGAAARQAHHRLLRRAALLLVLERVVAVAFAHVEHQRVHAPDAFASQQDLWRLLTFGEPGITGGLLLLYAMLLAAMPALAALRARAGAPATMLLSLSVYALAQVGDQHWPGWTFSVLDWQPVFVAGYLAGPHLSRLRDGSPASQRALLGSVSLLAAAFFVVRSGEACGIDPSVLPGWDFSKVPLRPAEMAWYLSASAATLAWSAWLYERSATARRDLQWVCRLGRWSLLIYIAHLFLQLAIVDVLTLTDPSPLGRTLALAAIAIAMSAVAWTAERWERWRLAGGASALAQTWRLVPTAGTVGGAVVAAVLGTVLALPRVLTEPAEWSQMRRAARGSAGVHSRVEGNARDEAAARTIASELVLEAEPTGGDEPSAHPTELEQPSPEALDAELDATDLPSIDVPALFGDGMAAP